VATQARLSPVLARSALVSNKPILRRPHNEDKGVLAEKMLATCRADCGESGGQFSYAVSNFHRSHRCADFRRNRQRWGNTGMSAALSSYAEGLRRTELGVWNAGGLHLTWRRGQ